MSVASVDRRRSPWLKRLGLLGVSFTLALALWWTASMFTSPVLLPSPDRVVVAWIEMISTGQYWRDLFATVQRVLVGFVGGSVLGVLAGLLVGRLPLLRGLTDPYIQFLRALPPIALIPLVIIWFGLGETSKYVITGYGAFFIVLVNTLDGVLRTPLMRERAARSLGASGVAVFWSVVLPSTMPSILTGMRVGIGAAFMSVVAAEMVAAESGIGFLTFQARLVIQTDRIFVGLVTLGLLGLIADRVFVWASNKFVGKYVRHLEHSQ